MKPLSASSISQRDAQHIFQSLRFGLVPERGIEAFAVGIEPQRDEIKRQLDFVRQNEGTIKFLRGGYGCGKTFMARLALLGELNPQEQHSLTGKPLLIADDAVGEPVMKEDVW